MTAIRLPAPATCGTCGLTTDDTNLLANHSCDIAQQGNRCEDFPCCGHEAGDCNGLLYGSDEAIKDQVYRDIASGHGSCDHENGFYDCEDMGYDEDEDSDTFPNG